VRSAASKGIPTSIPNVAWWAFRIFVRKSGKRTFDIENVPKIIVDAFSSQQIAKDHSNFAEAALYPEDTIEYVRIIQVGGERTSESDSTTVEIFGCRFTGMRRK